MSIFGGGELWQRQIEELKRSAGSAVTYAHFGTFKGDESGGCGSGLKTCGENAAKPPWGWDDEDDGPVYRGEMAFDPAHLAARYFRMREPLSQQYLRNLYLQDLADANIAQGGLPRGWPGPLIRKACSAN